ncbi:ribonucleoside hydrolase RihC [Enterococcus ureilyticus]|uniref:Ribonucleoside hydrolase RihC n=1 Tax=Enterococcus ureilyticus TaxID=1131292 RepID=A0A1E5HES4_9ENTE|nr:ribonucleoside hydrolase RihC [Enterococcus ureilyticus]MBM7689870.1 non-specific riboncleoside hydrolase [Enterococcus ureilyticus]OEG23130.1 ribonucleoside hydrolase RihC [Enterococcus ureilyticus]
MKNTRRIIIDTDPGIDDAAAIAAALFDERLDIRLFTTVAGNVSVDKVTKNLLKLLAFWDKTIPVAIGSDRPLLREAINASDVHGNSGMDGYDFPESKYELLTKNHAVIEMYKVLMDSKVKTTIVGIGPLTNIALLLRLYPECAEKIEELVIMGGALGRGNQGVLSEFNIAADPEAAKIVFESKISLTMVGLDVGEKALILPKEREQIQKMNKTGDMIDHLFRKYRGGSLDTGLKMYDGCAIAYLLAPEMFDVKQAYVAVETQGMLTAGATLVDLDGYLGKEDNCRVCVDLDEQRFRQWFLEAIEKCD